MKQMDVFGKMANISELKEKKTPTVGIDLGTTNSCVAIIKEGKIPEVIPMRNGNRTLQSCVLWTGKGEEFIVGQEAYNNRYKPNAIYSVKRMMGTDEKIVLKYARKELVLTPEEVSAKILKELMDNVKESYGEIKDAVITVPAYFNNKQLEATRKAGELAGLNVLKTFREPTSASLCYDLEEDKRKEELVLVYDLGGGTFDISLLRIANDTDCTEMDEIYGFPTDNVTDKSGAKTLTVLKTDGNSRLGGDDIDNELTNIILEKVANLGHDITKIPREYSEQLKLRLEQKKKSGNLMHQLVISLKLNDAHGTKIDERVQLTPDDFAKATKRIYDQTKEKMETVLNGVNPASISSIVLVGGSTKSKMLKELLRRDFPGIQLNDALNPDESVALGAAIEANRVKYGNASNVDIFDVLPLAIGVLADNTINKVILKNQVVPYGTSRVCKTTVDDQETISVEIYQGNSTIKEECIFLGNLEITDIPKGKAGAVKLEVKLNVNAEGILKCGVIIGDKFEEKILTNLFTGDTKQDAEIDYLTNLDEISKRKYLRWKRFADSLGDSTARDIISALLADFVDCTDKTNRAKIEELIIKHIGENKQTRRKVELMAIENNAGDLD